MWKTRLLYVIKSCRNDNNNWQQGVTKITSGRAKKHGERGPMVVVPDSLKDGFGLTDQNGFRN